MSNPKLGDLLLGEGMATPQQLRDALRHMGTNGGSLGTAVVTLGFVKDEALTRLLARHYGAPLVDLENLEVDPAVIKLISAETARKYQILPLSRSKTTLTIAMADPSNMFALDDIRFLTGCNLEPVIVGSKLDSAIVKYYGPMPDRGGRTGAGERPVSLKDLLDTKGLTLGDATVGLSGLDLTFDPDRPVETNLVVNLIHVLLLDSLKRGAHDIHIEPSEKEFRVRFRIDGALFNIMALPREWKDPISSQIKIMARLDIAEKRLPQEGQIKVKMAAGDRSRDICFRVSCLPTLFGETIVLRLFDESNLIFDMTQLGFEENSLNRFKRAIAKTRGLVLVTGPPGSGKTNTLYSAITSMQWRAMNINTAEDLVECALPEINQVQMRGMPGLSLAATLDSFLRQDIDVIMVDEIVDDQSAEAVVRIAARAGPLLLASVNDTDAPSAIQKLAHMSGQPFLLGRALSLAVAQTLVRRICAHCKVEVTDAPSRDIVELGVPADEVGAFKLYRGKGCLACNGTGYKGRVGLYEVMEVSQGIRQLIGRGAIAAETRRKAVEDGMLTLRMCGIEKVKVGTTTVEEVLRQTVPSMGTGGLGGRC